VLDPGLAVAWRWIGGSGKAGTPGPVPWTQQPEARRRAAQPPAAKLRACRGRCGSCGQRDAQPPALWSAGPDITGPLW